MLHKTLEHRFVKHIPDELEAGVLYVSLEYGSVVHSCCCGCGEEVVTPLTPTDWKLIFDGESVSLRPSVGSWSLPCRSHYVIDRGRVLVAEPWSENRIAAERQRDRLAKVEHFGRSGLEQESQPTRDDETEPAGWFTSLWRRLSGK